MIDLNAMAYHLTALIALIWSGWQEWRLRVHYVKKTVVKTRR